MAVANTEIMTLPRAQLEPLPDLYIVSVIPADVLNPESGGIVPRETGQIFPTGEGG